MAEGSAAPSLVLIKSESSALVRSGWCPRKARKLIGTFKNTVGSKMAGGHLSVTISFVLAVDDVMCSVNKSRSTGL